MKLLTCITCKCEVGDKAPTIESILNMPETEPMYFGDEDFSDCDECGRIVCMACAIYDFTGNHMRYLCPDCGEPTAVVMERIHAPTLFPLEIEI